MWEIASEEIVPKLEPCEQIVEASTNMQEAATAENITVAELPGPSNENKHDEEIIQYVTVDGEMVNLDDFEQFIVCDSNILKTINNEVEEITARKRKPNLNDFDKALLSVLEEHGREELEMQREEHDRKMKILKMQLEHGEEIHNERMNILKTKLSTLQQQIYHIDHVICNRRLKRKFKSGPI